MIEWQDENGKRIENFPQIGLIFQMMDLLDSESELSKTKCLQFIDEWGDTTFNQIQIPVLIDELNICLTKCRDEGKQQQYKEVIEFIKKAVDKTHTYIKFWGD
jgi:hypothetical protein